METLNLQTHGIAVYPNRKRLFWVTSLMVLLFLPMLGVDVFAIWAFWNHIWAFWHRYEIDTGAYVAATMLSIGTFFVGWGMFVALYRLRRRGPAIIINSQGFYTDFPLHFTFLLRSRQSFIPWEEIEWISSFHLSPGVMYTWLSLSLKHPAHYSHGLRPTGCAMSARGTDPPTCHLGDTTRPLPYLFGRWHAGCRPSRPS